MEVSILLLLLMPIIDPLSNRLVDDNGSIKLHFSELLLVIIILLTHLSYFKMGAFLFVCF